MKQFLLLPLSVVLSLSPLTVVAQQPEGIHQDVFRQLFPNPSGENGYEELVKAGDVARDSAAWREMELRMGQLTLAEQRRLMSDPDVKKALNLVRFGIGKQVSTPHKNGDDETVFPELARFRSLARLISIEMYVQLADGKMGQAIDTLADTLRFGYVIQTDSIIGGLVGIAVDAIGMKMISNHLDQLSARDCDRLVALVNQWMQLPDPLLNLIEDEKQMGKRILQKYRNQSDKFFAALGPGNPPDSDKQKIQSLQNAFNANPGSTGQVFDQATERLSTFYDSAIDNMRKPVWQRGDIAKLPPDDFPSSTIVSLLASSVNLVSDRYGREQAQVQILGVHAAIRRFRWEHNSLPGSLAELRLGRLLIDPFTGQPLKYKRIDDNSYEISSVGPIDRSEGASPGSRVAIK